jgi:hypothetical protein
MTQDLAPLWGRHLDGVWPHLKPSTTRNGLYILHQLMPLSMELTSPLYIKRSESLSFSKRGALKNLQQRSYFPFKKKVIL